MTVRISKGAERYLESRGLDTITLTYDEFPTACQLGVCKDIRFTFQPPSDPSRYRLMRALGRKVYVDRRLRPSGDIQIKKHGFWKLSFLYADKLRVPL